MNSSERKIVLQLAYDGTQFVGSQWQPHGRSVQGVLEQAWEQFTQEQRRFIFAGRTDSGVHAQGQIVHVSTATRHTPTTIQRALNALLADDVAVLRVGEIGPDFHARYSARWRKYRYVLDTNPVQVPVLRHYALHVTYPLDTPAMQAALDILPGEHDFAAFASSQEDNGSTMRQCYLAQCKSLMWYDQSLIGIELVANGFLRHMVRSIVGTLLLVGQRRLSPEGFGQVLISHERRLAGTTAAPHGLTLLAVSYPPEIVTPETCMWLCEDVE